MLCRVFFFVVLVTVVRNTLLIMLIYNFAVSLGVVYCFDTAYNEVRAVRRRDSRRPRALG